jgi:hypothetical protein
MDVKRIVNAKGETIKKPLLSLLLFRFVIACCRCLQFAVVAVYVVMKDNSRFTLCQVSCCGCSKDKIKEG